MDSTNRILSSQVSLPVRRLRMGKRRKHPCTHRRRHGISVHNRINDKRSIRSDGMLQNILEVPRFFDSGAVCTASLGQSNEVRIIKFSGFILFEAGHDFTSRPRAVCLMSDDVPSIVVKYNPYCRDVIFHGGTQDVGRHHEAAVTAYGHTHFVRGREFRTQDTPNPMPANPQDWSMAPGSRVL